MKLRLRLRLFLNFDRVESRVRGTYYYRCADCGTYFILTALGELLPVAQPDLLAKEAAK